MDTRRSADEGLPEVAEGAGGTASRGDPPARRDLRHRPQARPLIHGLRDPSVEAFSVEAEPLVRGDAQLAKVAARSIDTQMRLHLPRFTREELRRNVGGVYETIRPNILMRAASHNEATAEAISRARCSMLRGGELVRRDQTLSRSDGFNLRLEFNVTRPSVGNFIQLKLHYLRLPRGDTVLHIGMFLPGTTFPVTYLAFSAADRTYISAAMNNAGLDAELESTLLLTRVYALPQTPYNLVTLTIGAAMRWLRERCAYRYIVTAINPMLGFSGASFLAANFVPFATKPVAYTYDEDGSFTTRRAGGVGTHRAAFDTPHNLLLVAGVDADARFSVKSLSSIMRISDEDYYAKAVARRRLEEAISEDQLLKYRAALENAWSEKTIHPSYLTAGHRMPQSRGQCGVSSVWLQRELRVDHGIDATYCYGSLTFASPAYGAVDHHCWLEVGDPDDPNRVVVDITCDQAPSFPRKVIFASARSLEEQGIFYTPAHRLSLDVLPTDRVWRRFLQLDDAMASSRYGDRLADAV